MLHRMGLTNDKMRGIIAILFVIAIIVYPAFGLIVSPEVLGMAGLIVGYYFARRANGDVAPRK